VVHNCYKNLEYEAKTETILVEFNNVKKVVAVMLYNSCDINFALKSIRKISFYNGENKVLEVDNLSQNKDNYSLENNVMNYGGSINCSFEEIEVSSIKIEIDSKDKIVLDNPIIKTGGLVILGK